MKKVKRQFCEDCRFFWQQVASAEVGYCRRFPPTVGFIVDAEETSHELTTYPAVNQKEWCGEFRDASE